MPYVNRYEQPEFILSESYLDAEGIRRWKTNDQVPFSDTLSRLGLGADDLARHQAARDLDLASFATAYREAQALRTPEQLAEERAEARAAHGPGVELVNILTGEKYTT